MEIATQMHNFFCQKVFIGWMAFAKRNPRARAAIGWGFMAWIGVYTILWVLGPVHK